MFAAPEVDPASPLLFVINAASGSEDGEAKRRLIETALAAAGRSGDLRLCSSDGLARIAEQAAADALATRTAVVAVGGDGTINTVAQAAHAAGCAMGVVPQGTFNYFARTHGIPGDAAEAVRLLFEAQPLPVQVAAINERVFLVNASLGLYPDLLEDRETYKARFGRNRLVAFGAGAATLLRAQRRLRLRIEQGGASRELRTLTLFVGNNRLQLAQLGVKPPEADISRGGAGRITAVVLRPIGTLAMLRLMWHGAMGTLGETESIERFEFSHMSVMPARLKNRQGVKVAFDGEVTWMRPPLEFRVLDKPLFLMKAGRAIDPDRSFPDPGADRE